MFIFFFLPQSQAMCPLSLCRYLEKNKIDCLSRKLCHYPGLMALRYIYLWLCHWEGIRIFALACNSKLSYYLLSHYPCYFKLCCFRESPCIVCIRGANCFQPCSSVIIEPEFSDSFLITSFTFYFISCVSPAGKLPLQTDHEPSGHHQDDYRLGAGLCSVRPGHPILGPGGGQEPCSKGWVLCRVLLLLVLPLERLHPGVFFTFHLRGHLQPQHLSQHTQEKAPQQRGPAPTSTEQSRLGPRGSCPRVPQLGVGDEAGCEKLHPFPVLLALFGQSWSLNQQGSPAQPSVQG